MADLDDFFAKKDRKKSSKTKKFTTPEDLVKKAEEPAPKKVESKPRKEQQQQQQQPVVRSDGTTEEEQNDYEEVHEDEWKEFEIEERKDYTGLKIGQLQINDDDQSGSDGDGGEDGEGGGTENAEKRRAGPWKKMQGGQGGGGVAGVAGVAGAGAEAGAANTTATAPVNSSEETQEKPNTSKLYVSPALRNQQPLKPIRLRKGVLPDIHNEEYFPTLGSVKPEDIKKKQKEPAFEEVKHGGRYQRSSDISSNAPVAVENRYNSLADS